MCVNFEFMTIVHFVHLSTIGDDNHYATNGIFRKFLFVEISLWEVIKDFNTTVVSYSIVYSIVILLYMIYVRTSILMVNLIM